VLAHELFAGGSHLNSTPNGQCSRCSIGSPVHVYASQIGNLIGTCIHAHTIVVYEGLSTDLSTEFVEPGGKFPGPTASLLVVYRAGTTGSDLEAVPVKDATGWRVIALSDETRREGAASVRRHRLAGEDTPFILFYSGLSGSGANWSPERSEGHSLRCDYSPAHRHGRARHWHIGPMPRLPAACRAGVSQSCCTVHRPSRHHGTLCREETQTVKETVNV
jgi:hypothetical protein